MKGTERECTGFQQRFIHYNNYDRHVTEKQCNGSQPKLLCDGGKFKHIMNSSEKVFYGEIYSSPGKVAGGLNASPSLVVSTYITHCVTMEEKGARSLTEKKSWSMGTMLRHQQSISSIDANGTVVLAWDLPVTSTRKLLAWRTKSEVWAIM